MERQASSRTIRSSSCPLDETPFYCRLKTRWSRRSPLNVFLHDVTGFHIPRSAIFIHPLNSDLVAIAGFSLVRAILEAVKQAVSPIDCDAARQTLNQVLDLFEF